MYSHADFADDADFRSKICVYLWNLWDIKRVYQKNLRYLRNLRDPIKCGFSSLDRTGRFPFNPCVIRKTRMFPITPRDPMNKNSA